MFIELPKFLEDSSSSLIIFVVMGDFNGRVDDFHDELCVILILIKLDGLELESFYLCFFAEIQVLAYLDPTCIDKVVLLVIDSDDSSDGLSHSRCTSGRGGLRVAIGQIDQDVVEDIVDLDHKVLPEFLNADSGSNKRVLGELLDCVFEY